MQVEIRELTEHRGRAIISGTDVSLVNSLRRAMVAEVPKLAVEEVTVYDNTSALFDEVLSHRLSMLPIPTDLNLLSFRDQCVCGGEGCPNCTVLYTLSKEGPSIVYSGDLQPADRRWELPNPRIPLVKLLGGQRVMLEATAVLGTAQQHAKWQPVHGVGYQMYPDLELLSPDCPEDGACARMAPAVFSYEGGQVQLRDPEAFRFSPESLRMCREHIRVSLREDRFIFRWETDGSLSAKEALVRGIGVLTRKLREFDTGVVESIERGPVAASAEIQA